MHWLQVRSIHFVKWICCCNVVRIEKWDHALNNRNNWTWKLLKRVPKVQLNKWFWNTWSFLLLRKIPFFFFSRVKVMHRKYNAAYRRENNKKTYVRLNSSNFPFGVLFPRILKHWIPLKRIFLSSCTFQLQYFSLSLYIVNFMFEATQFFFFHRKSVESKIQRNCCVLFFRFLFCQWNKKIYSEKKKPPLLYTLQNESFRAKI